MPFPSPLECEVFNAIENATVVVVDLLGRGCIDSLTETITLAVNFVLKNTDYDGLYKQIHVGQNEINLQAQRLLEIVADYLHEHHLESDHIAGDEPLMRMLRVYELKDLAGLNPAA